MKHQIIKYMNRKITLLMLILPFLVEAQNPIIRDQFTADPTARVFNNKVYLYPSHDIIPPEGVQSCKDWFCMEDYHVFSSENLTQWKDHGIINTQNKVPWVKKDSYAMWAPDCIYRNGKYYFYFPSQNQNGEFAIGVAISDYPEGPFIPESEPIKGVMGIDPCVLQASDGNAYLFWGNGRCAMLKPNMKELAEAGKDCLEGLPNNQAEGPFVFEYNGSFYLTYPYVRENTEVLGYAMSKNPLGPYKYKGLIMAEHANGCWTNHHSIINYKDEWYLFYHHNPFSPNDDKRRSVQIEKLYFNPDGTIQEIKETMRGVGINQATEKIEIDRYSSASEDVTTSLIDINNPFLGFEATLPAKGSWFKYNDIDFDCLFDGYFIINVKVDADTELCLREGSTDGRAIGCLNMEMSNEWIDQTFNLQYVPRGVIDLVITNEGEGSISVNWVQFKNDITTSIIDNKNDFLSFGATLSSKGSWFKYSDIDFDYIGNGYLIINANATTDTQLCFREGNIEGKVIACLNMAMSNQWLNQTAYLDYVPSGITDLVITNEGEGAVSVNWVKFINGSNNDQYYENEKVETDSVSEEE